MSVQVSPCKVRGRRSELDVFQPRLILFSLASIIPPTLHTHLYLPVALTRRTNWKKPANLPKEIPFGNRGTFNRKITFIPYL